MPPTAIPVKDKLAGSVSRHGVARLRGLKTALFDSIAVFYIGAATSEGGLIAAQWKSRHHHDQC
jgi:hypothetical protein